MEFVVMRAVPLPHSTDTRLQQYAAARGISIEQAAAEGLGDFLLERCDIQIRIAAARAAAKA